MSWANDPPNPKVKDWNVTELKVSRVRVFELCLLTLLVHVQIDPHRRHVDKSTVAYFWKTLDTWTAVHKPSLMTT